MADSDTQINDLDLDEEDSGTQSLPSVLPLLKQMVEYADVPDERKQYFSRFFSEGRFSSMTYDDAAELLEIMKHSQGKLEKDLLESHDIDRISELTDLKAFVSQSLYEAEMGAIQDAVGPEIKLLDDSDEVAGATTSVPKNPDAKYMLNLLAGISQ